MTPAAAVGVVRRQAEAIRAAADLLPADAVPLMLPGDEDLAACAAALDAASGR